MKAMLFAAGKGTRLGKITEKTPKALLEVGGKTVLQHSVEKVTMHGFDEIIVNIHHHPGQMMSEISRLKAMGHRIEVSDETGRLLETGGGLCKAQWFFNDNKPFLLYNTDVITDMDLTDLYETHIGNGGIATLAVMNREADRYFLTDENGFLSGWCNTRTGEKIVTMKSGTEKMAAFAGIHVADPVIFSYMSEDIFSMTDLYIRLSGETNIHTYLFEGKWIDIGSEESLNEARNRAQDFISSRRQE